MPKKAPQHLYYPDIPLQGLLEANAKRFPNKNAIICGKEEFSYAEVNALSARFANALHGLKVSKGDRVALFMQNVPEFIVSYFGALKAGAVVTTISPLHREREVAYQLVDSGAQTIVTSVSFSPILNAIKEKTQLENIVVIDDADTSGVLVFQKLLSQNHTKPLQVELNPSEDLAALQYTGGTTGTAKGAMLTHRNLISNALAFAGAIEGKAEDIFLTALPLFHIYGLTTSLTTPISLGAKIILLPKFEAAKVIEAIHQHQVTVFCGVPTMYQMLLANPDLAKHDLTSIRVCISGASSLAPQIQRRFMDITGGFLAEGYGLTEASPVTHCTPVNRSLPLHVGSIGLPLSNTEVRIVDFETGQPLRQGGVGELVVKGPQVMKGYWHNPSETAIVLRDGWLLTGDIAKVDSDGYFYIVDRKKDLIKTKGCSVYPRELEDILYEHPDVKFCAVIGKPDVLAGEVPKAFVVLKEGLFISAHELMRFVNEKIAPYKALREVEFRSELPISGAGKILRRTLKAETLK